MKSEDVKKFIEEVNCSMFDARDALLFSNGDFSLAKDWVRLKGTSAFNNFLDKHKKPNQEDRIITLEDKIKKS